MIFIRTFVYLNNSCYLCSMNKQRAFQLATKLVNELTCPIESIEYVGLIDNRYIFHCIRKNHGKHIGFPLYASINEQGKSEWLEDGDLLYKAMTNNF